MQEKYDECLTTMKEKSHYSSMKETEIFMKEREAQHIFLLTSQANHSLIGIYSTRKEAEQQSTILYYELLTTFFEQGLIDIISNKVNTQKYDDARDIMHKCKFELSTLAREKNKYLGFNLNNGTVHKYNIYELPVGLPTNLERSLSYPLLTTL